MSLTADISAHRMGRMPDSTGTGARHGILSSTLDRHAAQPRRRGMRGDLVPPMLEVSATECRLNRCRSNQER